MKIHRFSFRIASVTFAGLLLAGPAAAAESVRIAVVNQQRALASSNEGRAAEKALKSLMQKKRTELEPLEQELKRQQEEFESQKYVLSRSALEERKLDLLKRQRDLERSMREAEDDLEIENRVLRYGQCLCGERADQSSGFALRSRRRAAVVQPLWAHSGAAWLPAGRAGG